MRNREIAKGLRLIAEGFNTIAQVYETEPVITGVDFGSKEGDTTVHMLVNTSTKEAEVTRIAGSVTEEPKKEVAKEEKAPIVEKPETPQETVMTEEELNKLTYNEIKAMAKQLGVKAVGSKKAIIENILSLNASQEAPEESEAPEEETTEEPINVDVEEDNGDLVDIEEEEEDTDVEAEPEGELSLYDQVVADLEGYSDEELADILSEIGVSPKGRRQALLAKIVQAIEDGQLEWSDEEEAEESEPVKEPTVDVKEVDEEEPEEDDFVGTEARKHACWEECEELEQQIDKGELSHKEVLKYLKDYFNGKYVSKGVDEDFNEYIAIQCDLIDDEGEKHELADPYYVGDDICCCGQVLKELKDGLFCEICGTEYESE